MKTFFNSISEFLGLKQSFVSHHEKLISAIGGFISLIIVITISKHFLSTNDSWLVIPSIGASAVLLFAVPHGPLSQPWPLIGGNVISATIGVTCALMIPNLTMAASAAVGLSILAMYYLKCIHPPGGATALSAALSGESIHTLGYEFVITPVFLNVISIFAIAILFNVFFHWRRYPTYLSYKRSENNQATAQEDFFNHDDFLNALKTIDSFVDVNEHDLKRIFALANLNAASTHMDACDIKIGKFYSNGKLGKGWSVRQIIDESSHQPPDKGFIIYKQITGNDEKINEYSTRAQFAHWARYEIINEDGQWKRNHNG